MALVGHLFKSLNRMYSTASSRVCTEIKIPVEWGFISGKWWGPQKNRPVIVLHGWQDNCGSFDTLIPLLPENVEFLAVDSPGHGYSSPIPNGMFYYAMDGAILIRRLQKYFDWPRLTLMGHSLGAIMCFMFTTTYPEDVEFFVALDGFKPIATKDIVNKRAQTIDNFIKYNYLRQLGNTEPPSYSMDVLAKMWHEGSRKSVALDKCEYLLKRNTAPSKIEPGKYYLTRDPRIKLGPLYNISQKEAIESARRLTMPVLAVKTSEMMYPGNKQDYIDVFNVTKESSSDFQFYNVEGPHHIHLNNPERIQNILSDFLNKYYVENTIVNDLKQINNLNYFLFSSRQ